MHAPVLMCELSYLLVGNGLHSTSGEYGLHFGIVAQIDLRTNDNVRRVRTVVRDLWQRVSRSG
jgi:hypothetical protein